MAEIPELLGLPYSPWSERARWALDASGVVYRSRTFRPLFGELGLRLKLRRFSGPVTVPVLSLPDGRCIADSVEIARWADEQGNRGLFRANADVARWLALAESGLAAGRALALRRMLTDPEALVAMVPKGLRGVLGRSAVPVAAFGIRRTLRKYAAPEDSTAATELDACLDALRGAVGNDPSGTVLGTFSYADIAMAQVLVFVQPPPMGPMRFGTAPRRAFTDAVRAERYADLLRWRNALYVRYRGGLEGEPQGPTSPRKTEGESR